MTVKQLYEGVLIEVRKENFPHLHLRSFNHYLNEAVSEIIDDVYLAFEKTQKSLDYLKAIKRTLVINNSAVDGLENTPDPASTEDTQLPELNITTGVGTFDNTVKFKLPSDYRHITNLIVKYKVNSKINDDCYEAGNEFQYGSKKVDDDTFASIIADPFQRPRYFGAKHAIINDEVFVFTGQKNILMNSVPLQLKTVTFSYLKIPKRYILTLSQAESDIVDASDDMEFDDITNRLILDRLILKILERNMDQRSASNNQISKIQTRQDVLAGSQPPQQ